MEPSFTHKPHLGLGVRIRTNLNSVRIRSISQGNLQTLIITLLKSISLEFARFPTWYEFARIQIECEANLHS